MAAGWKAARLAFLAMLCTSVTNAFVLKGNVSRDTTQMKTCESADWTNWVGLNPIPSYNPIVNNIDRLFQLISPLSGSTYTADWTGWAGINPIPSYSPITNNIDQLFSIVSNVLGQTHAADWTSWAGLNPIPSYNPIVNNIDQLFVLACQAAQMTDSPTPSPTSATSMSAVGDPHLRNMYGERFDLMKEGKSVLISIPRGKVGKDLLLVVEADAFSLGGQCADTYFQVLNITGAWADMVKPGGLRFDASSTSDEEPTWANFGPVELKVVHGRTEQGTRYLNFYVKHLGRVGFDVGGLLGSDDHTEAATPRQACLKRLALFSDQFMTDGPKGQSASVAEASA